MNRNGFTLIEMLVTISIILIISITGFITFNKILDNSKQKEYNRMVNEFETAAEVWLEKREDETLTLNNNTTIQKLILKQNLYNEKGTFYQLTLEKLADKGLIDNNLINPKSGQKFNYERNYVKLYYDENEVDGKNLKGLIAEYNEPPTPGIFAKAKIYKIKVKDKKSTFDPFENVNIISPDGQSLSKEEVVSPDSVSCDYKDNAEKINKYNNSNPFKVKCTYKFKNYNKAEISTSSYEVQFTSSIEGEYYYLAKEEEITVDLTRTYEIMGVGAKGKLNGTASSSGAQLIAKINLNAGDKIKIGVGGTESKLGGGQDGNKATSNNGGDATYIKVNGTIVFAAAGGGGGSDKANANTTVSNDSNILTTSGGNGGIGLGPVTKTTAVNGSNGLYGGGSGAGNTYKQCVTGTVRDGCQTRKRCSSCDCETANTCTSSCCGTGNKSCTSGSCCGYKYYFGDNTRTGWRSSKASSGVSKCKSSTLGDYRRWNFDSKCVDCRYSPSPPCNRNKGNNRKDYCTSWNYKWTYDKCKRSAKSCTKSCCGTYNKSCTSVGCCGCKTYKRCNSCDCETWKIKNVTCSSSNNYCSTGDTPSCTNSKDVTNSGSGGQNYINKNNITSTTEGSTGTYKNDSGTNIQGSNGYLKITQEYPKAE